jgi:hypothetical protein
MSLTYEQSKEEQRELRQKIAADTLQNAIANIRDDAGIRLVLEIGASQAAIVDAERTAAEFERHKAKLVSISADAVRCRAAIEASEASARKRAADAWIAARLSGTEEEMAETPTPRQAFDEVLLELNRRRRQVDNDLIEAEALVHKARRDFHDSWLALLAYLKQSIAPGLWALAAGTDQLVIHQTKASAYAKLWYEFEQGAYERARRESNV